MTERNPDGFVRANELAGVEPQSRARKRCEGCEREFETANPAQRFCWTGCKGQQAWTARRTEQFQRALNRKGLPVTWGCGKPRA